MSWDRRKRDAPAARRRPGVKKRGMVLPEGIGLTIARHRKSHRGSLVVGIRRSGVDLRDDWGGRRWTSWDRLAEDYRLEPVSKEG